MAKILFFQHTLRLPITYMLVTSKYPDKKFRLTAYFSAIVYFSQLNWSFFFLCWENLIVAQLTGIAASQKNPKSVRQEWNTAFFQQKYGERELLYL